MSLPFYQKIHEHYDSSYRSKDLRTTMSQYQQEKKRSAIYTQGSTAYSSRSSAAHRQESAAFSQLSTASYQQQASRASEASLQSAVHQKAASTYDYGYSRGYVKRSSLNDSPLSLFRLFFLYQTWGVYFIYFNLFLRDRGLQYC